MQQVSRIALPTRIQGAVDRVEGAWKVWLHTNDFKYGTFLLLHDDGSATRVTVRYGEGDDEHIIKPKEQ
jgi:hypothetical protein